jgi:hypothetical protein
LSSQLIAAALAQGDQAENQHRSCRERRPPGVVPSARSNDHQGKYRRGDTRDCSRRSGTQQKATLLIVTSQSRDRAHSGEFAIFLLQPFPLQNKILQVVKNECCPSPGLDQRHEIEL